METKALSVQEKARLERVNALRAQLEAQGYSCRELTRSLKGAGVLSVVYALPFALILSGIFFLKNPEAIGKILSAGFTEVLLFFVVILLLMVVHELVHGLTWGLCAKKKFKTIEFGILKSTMTPYCYCGEALPKSAYLAGSFMPCLVLGLLPSVAAILTGSVFLMLIGLCMTLAAGGDLMVMTDLLRYKPKATQMICMDHPVECGLLIFERI